MGKLILLIMRAQWDRAAAVFGVLLAAIVLLVGYLGVASTSYPAEQTPYIVSGGILGIMLVGIAATLWLSADMRDEWRKLDELSSQMRAMGIDLHETGAVPVVARTVGAPEVPETYDVPGTVAARVTPRRKKATVQKQRT
jgi:hypothetical protein